VKFFTTIIAFVLLVAPTQAHIDVVAFDMIESHTNDVNFIASHQDSHHEHDSDDEKKTEHHHHCVDMSVSFAHIPATFSYVFISIPNKRQLVSFYNKQHNSNHLEAIFHPPQV